MTGQVAIVTGASSGIGLALARKWVQAGGRVALVARRKALLDEHVAALGAERAAAFALDVTDLDALALLPGRVVERFGALHAVVNNAGLNHRGPITRHTPRALADIITTNLTAPIVLTRAAVDHLRPGGAIVNVASLAGFIPFADEATYCASKAGLRAFTRAVRDEHPELRIGVVSPGPVDTDFFGEIEEVPDLVFSQPMSSPEAVADAVLSCIAENSSEIPMPRLSGALATVGYVFPSLARKLRPLLAKRGAANKAKHLARKKA